MSNRSKRVVTIDAEPRFLDSCLDKWAKGTQRGARWDKVNFLS